MYLETTKSPCKRLMEIKKVSKNKRKLKKVKINLKLNKIRIKQHNQWKLENLIN